MTDEVWCVYSSLETVSERLQSRRKLSAEEVKKRIAAQMDPDDRVKKCHRIIKNNGSIDDLNAATMKCWQDFIFEVFERELT